MAAGAEQIRKHVRLYWCIFGALAVLTVVTVAANNLQVGVVVGVFIALAIATLKGSLVAGFFMHLAFDRNRSLFALLILCAIFFAVLLLIPVLTMEETRALENVP